MNLTVDEIRKLLAPMEGSLETNVERVNGPDDNLVRFQIAAPGAVA